MRYSIIIPTLNKCEELLKPCVESILKYTTFNAPDNAELIIVANGCTDGTEAYIREVQSKFHNVAILTYPKAIGYTKAINEGAKIARGEYLAVLNNDTILLPQAYNEWLEVLNKPFVSMGDPVGVTGPMKVPNDSTRRPFIIFFCAMISRGCWDNVGGLDEIFSPGYGEDTDFCLKAEKLGYAVIQVPTDSSKYYQPNRMVGDFPIYHIGNQTFGQPEHQDEQLIYKNNQILLERYGILGEGTLSEKNKELFSAAYQEEQLDVSRKIVEKYAIRPFVNIERAKKCDGYMADSELEWLATQAKQHKIIIEIGSWHGKSSRALGDNLMEDGHLICVDHWKGSAAEQTTGHQTARELDGDAAYLEFLGNMWDLVGGKQVSTLRLSSKNAARYLLEHDYKADMIFIDAGHTKEEVKADIEAWLPLLAKDGMICGHDAFHVNNPWPGVLEAVTEIFGVRAKQAPNTSIWVVENISNENYTVKTPIKRPPCVFDCFPFNNELDILERRFQTLYDYVDRFIIVEAMETHAGKPKDLVFNNNLDRFAKYLNKVTYGPCVIKKFPEFGGSITDQSWARERYQRDNIMKGLGDCQDDDIVIISDVDEIPNPDSIKYFKGWRDQGLPPICAFEMDLYYYNEHVKAKDKWLEAKITTYGKLKELGPCGVRYSKMDGRIPGGKHLSYFGGVDSIIKKIEDTAHQEYNTDQYKDKALIFQRMMKGEDVFGRSDIKFERV